MTVLEQKSGDGTIVATSERTEDGDQECIATLVEAIEPSEISDAEYLLHIPASQIRIREYYMELPDARKQIARKAIKYLPGRIALYEVKSSKLIVELKYEDEKVDPAILGQGEEKKHRNERYISYDLEKLGALEKPMSSVWWHARIEEQEGIVYGSYTGWLRYGVAAGLDFPSEDIRETVAKQMPAGDYVSSSKACEACVQLYRLIGGQLSGCRHDESLTWKGQLGILFSSSHTRNDGSYGLQVYLEDFPRYEGSYQLDNPVEKGRISDYSHSDLVPARAIWKAKTLLQDKKLSLEKRIIEAAEAQDGETSTKLGRSLRNIKAYGAKEVERILFYHNGDATKDPVYLKAEELGHTDVMTDFANRTLKRAEYEEYADKNSIDLGYLHCAMYNNGDEDIDEDVRDLTERRAALEIYNETNSGGQYKKLDAELNEFIRKHCKETDRYIEIPSAGLRLDKKPCKMHVKDPNNAAEAVFEYRRDKYFGPKNVRYPNMIAISQKVLNDPSHPMYIVVQGVIEKREQEGYRPATKADLEKLIQVLPGADESERLYGVVKLSGWHGWGMLDGISKDNEGNINVRSFVGLQFDRASRNFKEDQHPAHHGSLLFLQDIGG